MTDTPEKKIKREFILITKEEPKSPPSRLDKLERIAKIVSLVGVPIIIAIVGWLIQQQLGNKNLNKDYVNIAVQILADPKTKDDHEFRSWAVELLNATSPTKFTKETADGLKAGIVSLPRNLNQDLMATSAVAKSYQSSGDYEKALEGYEKALETKIRLLGSNHPEVAKSYNNLGGLYSSMGQYDLAVDLYSKALEINSKTLGERSSQATMSMVNLGNTFVALGDLNKAESLYLKALAVISKTSTRTSPNYKQTLVKLMELYNLLGNQQKGEKIRQELNELLEYE